MSEQTWAFTGTICPKCEQARLLGDGRHHDVDLERDDGRTAWADEAAKCPDADYCGWTGYLRDDEPVEFFDLEPDEPDSDMAYELHKEINDDR